MKRNILLFSISFLCLLIIATWYVVSKRNSSAYARSIAQYDRAVDLYGRGFSDEALVELDGLLTEEPEHVEALVLKGKILLNDRGELSESLDIYRQAIKLDPSSAEAHAGLGTGLRLQAKSNGMDADGYEEAIKHLKEAIKLDPDSFVGYAELGYAYRDLGQFPEALEALKKAMEIKPGATRPHAVTGLIKAGRYSQ